MGAALDAGLDLSGLAGCFLLIGLLAVVGYTFEKLADVLNFGINVGFTTVRPLAGVGDAIRATIVSGCNDGIKALERQAAKFESGLIDAFGILLGIGILLGEGVHAALVYLWDHALDPRIEHIVGAVRSTASKAAGSVAAIERDIYDLSVSLPHKIASAVDAGVTRAERFTVDHVASAETSLHKQLAGDVTALRKEIAGAVQTAESYADSTDAELKRLEDAAIASIRAQASAAASAAAGAVGAEAEQARKAAEAAVSGLEATLEAEISAAKAQAATDLASARAAVDQALTQLRSIAVGAEQELQTIEGTLGAAGLAALIASIPALATLTHAIADEAGLGSGECRSKVKGICRTPTSSWLRLLEGLALAAAVADVHELIQLFEDGAGRLVPELERLIAA